MTMPAIDLTDVDMFVQQRHHELFAWLRTHEPIHRHPLGFWAVTRHADIARIYADNGVFSSANGPMLGGSYSSEETDSAANRMLVASDPPRHRILRQLLHRAFAPDLLSRVEHQVEVLVEDALAKALSAGSCDFAVDIAPELPAAALMVLMGVTHEQAHTLIGMTRQMIGFRDPHWVETSGDERLRLATIQADIFDFFADILWARRAKPGEDMVSLLAGADLNGRRLTDEEILYNCLNLAVGGNETSSHSATAGLLALIENPDQYQLLVEASDVPQSATNEILRWATTNAYVLRVAKQDVEVGGQRIGAGDPVTLWNVSANRDETEFVDADRFLLRRSPNRHLSYGAGIHRCIGANLAQVELSTLFRRCVHKKIRFTLAGDVVRLRSNFIQGISSLPVEMAV